MGIVVLCSHTCAQVRQLGGGCHYTSFQHYLSLSLSLSASVNPYFSDRLLDRSMPEISQVNRALKDARKGTLNVSLQAITARYFPYEFLPSSFCRATNKSLVSCQSLEPFSPPAQGRDTMSETAGVISNNCPVR